MHEGPGTQTLILAWRDGEAGARDRLIAQIHPALRGSPGSATRRCRPGT